MSRCTECRQRIAGWCRQAYSFFAHQTKSEWCRKTFLFLAYLVAILGSIAYCLYLIWLITHVKDIGYFLNLAYMFLPLALVLDLGIFILSKSCLSVVSFNVACMLLMVMCFFTLLTREAYYHLSPDDLIGPQWVIMSLKGSIVFFVCGFFIRRERRLQNILKDKEILNCGLLDFLDIFNMVELLSFNKSVGIGSFVTEESSLEVAIQAFCTMSLLIIGCIGVPMYKVKERLDADLQAKVHVIYKLSPILQNIPFLVIRIIVWSRYNVYSLGFMVKNVWAIVVCCAQLLSGDSNDNDNNNDKASLITMQTGTLFTQSEFV